MNNAGFESLSQGLPAGINFPVTMAPMVGLSHCAFRQLVREYLPEGALTLWPSEMLNSRRIPDEILDRIPEAMTMGDENFWMPQILANDETKIAQSLPKLFSHGARGIDINMGCPVNKALKHNYGVALMGDADYAAQVVEYAVKYSEGPVSVKLRGMDTAKKEDWLHFIKKLESAGANWLTLHPRTPEQKRRGNADWTQIKELKQSIGIPVIGNGDIQTCEDIVDMLATTGCDMVMAGRALTARPWLFWQYGRRMGWKNPLNKTGEPPSTPEEEALEYGRSLLRLIELMTEKFSEPLAMRKFLFHVKTGSVWLPFGHSLHAKLTQVKDFAIARERIQEFFAVPHQMSQKTYLRQ